MSDKKKVIVIGAGLSGLSSGIYAALNGYRVRIFEHANQAGGVTATWKRKGFVIDGGMHFFMNCFPGSPAQIVNLLLDLKQDLGLTILFISHDLGLVRHIADQVMVIYLGRLMETGPARKVYDDPCHPYTKALLSAVPIPEPGLKRKRTLLSGSPSSPIDPPLGCVFHPRCPEAKKECALSVPELREVLPGHFLACPG